MLAGMPSTWTKATLGSLAQRGEPVTIWCENYGCRYRLTQGSQYRAVLSPADLVALAERYGAETTFIDYRARLQCRHCGSREISTKVDHHYVTPAERREKGGSTVAFSGRPLTEEELVAEALRVDRPGSMLDRASPALSGRQPDEALEDSDRLLGPCAAR